MNCVTTLLLLWFCGLAWPNQTSAQSDETLQRIKASAPGKAFAKPDKRRTLLVFTLTRGFRHASIPTGARAIQILGDKTGAFAALVTDDIAMFEPDVLPYFDAVLMLNTTGELFLPPGYEKLSKDDRATADARDARLKKSLLDYIAGGKGLIGIHAATDCFYQWPAYGRLIGAYFDGHPWHEKVGLKLDDPDHAINSPLKGKPFEIVDEIYQFRAPYARDRLRVLLSLDVKRTNMSKGGIHRTDGDFAVSWVRNYKKGRVFYCSLGHRDEIFWNPAVLAHYLAGIQFALGDLEADASPSATPSAPAKASVPPGFTPLFNGKNLAGWKGLVGSPAKRAAMTPEQRAEAQRKADAKMRAHWKAEDGVLVFDGKGDHICTTKDYGDFELLVDWRIEAGGDSGIYLRGSPQVQIWDPAQWSEGSGGLYNNQHNPSKPLVRADRPIGQWNTFGIKMIGETVTVDLNGVRVVDNTTLENYWERAKPIYPRGQIELQSHGSRLMFRNIFIREIRPTEARAHNDHPTWRELFNGVDLTGLACKEGAWVAKRGTLMLRGGDSIWTERRFGDFVMELEFMFEPGANSGIFFRTDDTRNCVQTGIELQVLDSYGKEKPDKHDCGAIYDCVAPAKNAVKPAGEWNHAVLTCKGSSIHVVMNGQKIIDMNLDNWTEPHKNPDGTKNKFNTPYKQMPRTGHIGFQDHGTPVWYRNIRIMPLGE